MAQGRGVLMDGQPESVLLGVSGPQATEALNGTSRRRRSTKMSRPSFGKMATSESFGSSTLGRSLRMKPWISSLRKFRLCRCQSLRGSQLSCPGSRCPGFQGLNSRFYMAYILPALASRD